MKWIERNRVQEEKAGCWLAQMIVLVDLQVRYWLYPCRCGLIVRLCRLAWTGFCRVREGLNRLGAAQVYSSWVGQGNGSGEFWVAGSHCYRV